MTKIKLSGSQRKIIELMKKGWSLSVATTMDGRIYLQEGRPGCGGEMERVHANSFWSLRIKGLIKQIKYGFPSSEWGLTEKGANQ